MIAGSVMGKLLTPSLALAAAALVLIPAPKAVGDEVDLTTSDSGLITGTVGGTAFVTRSDTMPAGRGVFDPFLSLNKNGGIERAYNTGNGLFLDAQVPASNTDLHMRDLAIITDPAPGVTGSFYGFELNANETGNGNINRLLSIDNIRIYTSPTDNVASVGDTESALDSLGKLRFALNEGLKDANGNYIIDNWIKIDSTLGSTSGSGSSDMTVYIPTDAFGDADKDDLVYFYNLNGVHESADAGTEANAGPEYWRAIQGTDVSTVPDGGNTLALMSSALVALGFVAGRRKMMNNA